MIPQTELLKGIHPGVYLTRELARRKLRGSALAARVGVCRQNLSAILRGQRRMNLPLSLRIESELGLPEGFLMTLQLHYDIAALRQREEAVHHPDVAKFRPALFWDVDMSKIDWYRNRAFVIQRVFERGDAEEIGETLRFYGREEILRQLRFEDGPCAPMLRKNAIAYLNYAG